MSFLTERVSGRERLRLICALAFWVATYLLFLAWNQLQDEFPSAIWQTRRLLATACGAGLFYGFTLLADRIGTRPLRERLAILAAAGLGCCLAMVALRSAIDWLVVRELGGQLSTFERHLRFALIWAGYFAGGVLAFLSFAQPEKERSAQLDDEQGSKARRPDALWVSRGRERVRVPVAAIEWIEAEGDYVRLHAGASGGLLRATLSGLEQTLDPDRFARVHRSVICRRDLIAALLRKPSGALAVRLEGGAEVPVGRRYRDTVIAVVDAARVRG
jgi:hypothetical protein